jgi:hypothetical protein
MEQSARRMAIKRPPMGWIRTERDRRAQQRVDPYFEWARDTGFAYFFAESVKYRGTQLFPVIIELDGLTARNFARGEWRAPRRWRQLIRVPDLYRDPAAGLEKVRFCSAMVSEAFFDQLGENALLRAAIRRVELGVPIEGLGRALPLRLPPVPRARRGTVVTGVIDDGMAFAHESFRLPDGSSRVEYFWNQDAPPPAPSGFAYGCEFSKFGPAPGGIDAALSSAAHGGLVDEDEVYRATGHLHADAIGHKPVAWRVAHGTHVMDLAAGFDMETAPERRPIIAVQLPVRVTADTSGGTFGPYALDALHYIVKRADQMGVQPLPVVANLSYGFVAGPHDGSSVFEQAVDEAIALRPAPLDVVLPAGNNHLSRCHARFRLRPASELPEPLRWRIQPDDSTPSYLQVWLPHTTGPQRPRIRLRIRTPYGNWSPWVDEGDVWTWKPSGQTLCKVVYYDSAAPGRNRNMVLIAVAPTAALTAGRPLAPAGVWEIAVKNAGPAASIDAWIQRDDRAYGYAAGGRQSYFDDPRYERFDASGIEVQLDNASYVKRAGTLNSIATGRNTVVVGGYQRKQATRSYFSERPSYTPASYSASGPIVRPPAGPVHRTGPDAMTVSEDSAMNDGVLAAGTRSGSVGSMWGSSVAAPQVARWIAGEMAAGRPHGRTAVANWAQQQEAARPAPNPKPALERMGAGRAEIPPRKPHRRYTP